LDLEVQEERRLDFEEGRRSCTLILEITLDEVDWTTVRKKIGV
jgi:hypothetical protein